MAETTATRKLAAILSADVVGYSRLMGDDEQATLATLTEYRAVMREHITTRRGRVVDSPGDALLAEFPSAVQAVEAGVAIQRELAMRNDDLPDHRRMHMRIGINLGDVIEQDGALYGDGVNIAARLEALSQQGGICISGTVFDQIENKIDVPIKYAGRQSVKNIATPVRAYHVSTGTEGKTPLSSKRRIVAGAAALIAIVALTGAITWLVWQPTSNSPVSTVDPVLSIPKGPSIAVLPFENLSGDSEQDIFAAGISEDLLTQLSYFSGIRVIARDSTLQARAQALDVREIGEKLDAKYVLDGSVRRAGDQLRITAQLLKTQDGSQVWAKTYDRDANIAAVFEIQDQITTEIASILAGTTGVIAKSEIASIKRKSPDKLQSYECVLLGHVYQQIWDEESHLAARDCLTRTVEDDPTFADAWAWLAHLHVDEAMWRFNPMDGSPDALTRAETAAKRALEEDRRNQKARLGLAAVHFARRDIVGFASEAEQALAINPNDADVLAEMAWRYAYAVDWKRGLAMMQKAMALNPLHPGWYHIAFFFDAYGRAQYEQALEAARKAEAPGNYLSYVMLAAVYGQLGRKTEAPKALDALLKLYPDFQDHARDELENILISNPEYVDRMLDGLKKAGLDVPDRSAASN